MRTCVVRDAFRRAWVVRFDYPAQVVVAWTMRDGGSAQQQTPVRHPRSRCARSPDPRSPRETAARIPWRSPPRLRCRHWSRGPDAVEEKDLEAESRGNVPVEAEGGADRRGAVARPRQQDAYHPGDNPYELTRPERLFDKEKMRQHRNHQRNRRLQHRDYGTVDPADCRSGQNVGQPPIGGPENDHVTEVRPRRRLLWAVVSRPRSAPQCQPSE